MIRVVVAAVGLVVAGCSASKQAPEPRPLDSPAVAWAEKVCVSVEAGAAKLSTLPAMDTTDPVSTRDGMVAYLGDLVTALGGLADGIRAAGTPPVPDGTVAVDNALRTLTTTRTGIETAVATLSGTSTADPVALRRAMEDVGTGLAQLGTEEGPTKDLKANPELRDAFSKAPACRRLDGA